MVTLVKHEWHQVDSQFEMELTIDLLEEVYPNMKKRELKQRLGDIESGEYSVQDLINDAESENVYFDWDRTYDDWWTERKGGYDVTFEVTQPREATEEEMIDLINELEMLETQVLPLEEALEVAKEELPQEWPFIEPEEKPAKKKKKKK